MNPFSGLRPWQPAHVKNLLRALLTHRAALDASDTGVGKTPCALAIARIFGVTPLILGPKATRVGWEDFSKMMGVPIQFENYEKARIDAVPHECPECGRRRSRSPKDIVAIGTPVCPTYDCSRFNQPMTPEYVDRLGYEQPHGKGSLWVWRVKPAMMVFDEGHLCGGSTSITGKMLRSARLATDNILILSATAADNPEHLKNLGRALGLFDSRSYVPWLMKHGLRPDYTGNWTMTDDTNELDASMKAIHHEIFPSRGARLKRSDIPGFPKTLIDTLLLDPESDLEEANKLMKSPALGDRVIARKAYEMEMVRVLPDYLLQSRENGNNIGVFLNFTITVDTLAEWARKRKFRVGIVDGRQVGEKGDIERRRVMEGIRNGALDFLISNNRAGGAGASYHHPTIPADVYISPSEDGRQMKQVCGRFWRDGGAFSRQFFLGLNGTPQEEDLRSNREKIQRIDILNGDELAAMKFI